MVGAADAELSRRRASDQKRDQIAIGIKPALGKCDQCTCKWLALWHHHQRFKPLIERKLLPRRRHRHDFAARARKALAEIETQHLIDALKADIEQRTIQ